jgi:UDP-N-acetylglucosamine diphosphorylase / glucose-1-phosphate thymidylyltransferase / UDP-N-acetylgalactosamine diphosphorylase / glucosamine-1-phosphate N-acetyltransferase / galactosamine-1-phosphate N-acetyltransferase
LNICIYENNKETLLPITYTKNISELKIGGLSNYSRIKMLFPDSNIHVAFDENSFSENSNIIVNSRVVLDTDILNKIKQSSGNIAYFSADKFVAGVISAQAGIQNLDFNSIENKQYWKQIGCSLCDIEVNYIEYLWDIIKANPKAIENDFNLLKSDCEINDTNVELIGDKSNLYIGKNVKFYGKIVINVEAGPVFINDNVTIKAPSVIEGPVFIDSNSLIDCAKIRKNTTIGEFCRISGEVEDSIFHSYTNKHHTGFIGHSYIGSWVNMGALTTNSDLKNNYHSVKVYNCGEFKDTQELKIGCFVGDFTTFGIGSLIPTGANIGACCNVFGGGLIERYYPLFKWHNTNKNICEQYKIEKFKDTISIMMQRRGKDFKELEKKIEELFEISKNE